MIGIVDYGLGNVQAFLTNYKRLGIDALRLKDKDSINIVDKIILPGVGSFDHAMTKLNESGLRDSLENAVISNKLPILGVCVGMQMLSNESEEGKLSGLGWINGKVKHMRDNDNVDLILPHMGWNNVNVVKENNLLGDDLDQTPFYFLHSYFFDCEYDANIIAKTNYGKNFASIVSDKNIFGIQCHPEKSHISGYTLLKNFAELEC